MSQNNSVDMSQYREQHQLLSTRPLEQPYANINSSSSQVIQHALSPSIESQVNLQNNQNNQQIQPQPAPVIPANIPNNIVPRQDFRIRIFRILLDASLVFYFFTSYISTGTVSFFAKIWLVYYGLNWVKTGSKCQYLNRNTIVIIYAFLLGKWFFMGKQTLIIDQRIYLTIYLIQMIPFVCKFCCVCCVSSMVCLCMTCCSCFYCCSEIHKSIQNALKKWRSRGLKEHLCKQDLTTVDDRQCPICLQVGNPMNTLSCHHSFHPKCLSAWIDSHNTCPICRSVLY